MKMISTNTKRMPLVAKLKKEYQVSCTKINGHTMKSTLKEKENLLAFQTVDRQEKRSIPIAYSRNNGIEKETIKNPETPKKMEKIYQWIHEENWMEDEAIIEKVQNIAKTIL